MTLSGIEHRHRQSHTLLVLAGLMWAPACGGQIDISAEEEAAVTIQLTSSAFDEGQSIPTRHTCDGQDVSPPLAWSGVPEGTRSLALICDDPDAPMGTWVHWVVCDLPHTATSLPEGVPSTERLESGAAQGRNDFGRIGYGGPCPPRGASHRYFFRLYALDIELGLAPGVSRDDVARAMQGHILGHGELMGTYQRR